MLLTQGRRTHSFPRHIQYISQKPFHRVSAIIPHKNRNESRSHLIMDPTRSHGWVSEAFLHECLRYNDDLFFNSYPYLRTLPSGMGSEEKCCSDPSTAQHPCLQHHNLFDAYRYDSFSRGCSRNLRPITQSYHSQSPI